MAYASWSVVFGEQPSAAKWNILGTNDASFNDGTGIGDSAITPAKLLTGTGTTWAWSSWTPTYSGITVGDGTVVAKYKQIGKTVHFYFAFTLGSTSAIATPAQFTLPVTAVSTYVTSEAAPVGRAYFKDASGDTKEGSVRLESTTNARLIVTNTSSTYAALNGLTNLIPFTWTSTDIIGCSGTYEAA